MTKLGEAEAMNEGASGADLGMLLAVCCERLVRGLFARLGPAGYGHLTSSQAITVLLVGTGIDTVTHLADRTGMTTQACSKICATLHGMDLLDRQPHASDARSRRLALTEEGNRVLGLLRTGGDDELRAWTNLVGGDTMRTVQAALAAYAHSPDLNPPAPQARLRFT